jgi:GNAT superfamily N-acetyltransferase
MPSVAGASLADAWVVDALSSHHDHKSFVCGEAGLDEYIEHYATQDTQRSLTRAFVLTREGETAVRGYYTLSATHIQRERFPPERARKLPYYPIPAVLLGRLAIAQVLQGEGLGEFLLIDALKRVALASETIGVHAVLVEAINERAANFYRAIGFIALPDDPRRLFLPLATIRQLP